MTTCIHAASFELPRSVGAPGLARALIARHLCSVHGRSALEATQLLASELTTCAVLYGEAPIVLSLECTGPELHLTVSHATIHAAAEDLPVEEEGGLRSALLDKLARSWGVDLTTRGRRLWCSITTGAVGQPLREQVVPMLRVAR